MYERLGLGITLDFDDRASAKTQHLVTQFENLINVSGRLVNGIDAGMSSLHFEGLTVAGFALERLAVTMNMYGQRIIKGFVAIGKSVIDMGSKMETYKNIFEVFYKNSATAQKKLQWAMDYAAKTPFEMEDVITAMKAMKAIGVEVDKTYSTATGSTRTLMDALGDLAILAPPEQGIRGMMIGIRNLYGGMERSFMTRMDIKPSQILGHSIGKTTEEVTEALIELSEKLAPQMMGKLFGTWTQTISNFRDQYNRLLYSLSSHGAFDAAKKSLMEVYSTLNTIRGDELQTLGKNLGEVFTFLWKPVDAIAKGIGKLIEAFKELSKSYPIIMKVVAGITLASGAFLIGTAAILKWAGVILMAVAAIATFYVNIIVFRAHIETMNLALMRSLKSIGLFIKAFTLGAIILGSAIYAYEKNLLGFRDTIDDVLKEIKLSWTTAWDYLFGDNFIGRSSRLKNLEGLTRTFAKIIAFGRLMKILFTQDLGDKVFFTERQYADFNSLGMWDMARLFVMIKGKSESFITGFVKGLEIVTKMMKTFIEIALAPVYALLKGLDSIITSLTGKKSFLGVVLGEDNTEKYKATGKLLGTIFGLLMGFKVVKTLGSFLVSPFRALSRELTTVGEKIKWSGGLFKRAFTKVNPFFYREGKHASNNYTLADLMNADNDEATSLRYSRNPLQRYAEQRQLYGHVGNLKKIQIADTLGTAKQTMYANFLNKNERDKVDFEKNKLLTDLGADKANEYMSGLNKTMFNDPTQGFLSRLFMGRRSLLYNGEKTDIINGQNITVPDMREMRQGGLLSSFFSKYGMGDYNARGFDAQEGTLGLEEGYHKNIVKNAFKNYAKEKGNNVLGKGKTLLSSLEDSINEKANYNRFFALSDADKNKVYALRRTIGTMEAKGNTRQLPSIRKQLENVLPAYSIRDSVKGKASSIWGKTKGIASAVTSPVSSFWRDAVAPITMTGSLRGDFASARDYIGNTRVGGAVFRGTSALGRGIRDTIGTDLPQRGIKRAWGITKGVGKGAVGALGMGARGLGMLGGGLMAAAPWLAAAGAVGGAIYGKLSGGEKGTKGLDNAKANLKKITESWDKDGGKIATNFFDNFIKQGKEIWPIIVKFGKAVFTGLAKSKVFERIWEGLKMGAALAWKWIQTEGVTYLGLAIKWVITDGIPLVLKGLIALGLWLITGFLPFVAKLIFNISKMLLTLLKDAVKGAFIGAINLIAALLPDWVKKLFGDGKIEVELSNGKSGGYASDTDRSATQGFTAQYHHKGLNMSPTEHVAIIKKKETVLPEAISQKLNSALTTNNSNNQGITIQHMEVNVQAEKLSRSDAKKQALMIIEEIKVINEESKLRKGKPVIQFA